jgi:alanine racemase
LLRSFEAAINNGKLSDRPIPVHIKLDTGMHRLGFETDDLNELIKIIKANPKIEIKSVFLIRVK